VYLVIHDLLDKNVYIANLSKNETLEHPEPLRRVEDLEGSETSQHIQRFVSAVVDPIVWIFVKNVQN